MAIGPLSPREFIRKLRALGYDGPFAGGNHQYMAKVSARVRIPNPHSGRDIDVSLIRRILQVSGIKPEEWDNA